MPTIDAVVLSTKAPTKVAEEFKRIAKERDMSPAALLNELVSALVGGSAMMPPATNEKVTEAAEDSDRVGLDEETKLRYACALSFVDDYMAAGYSNGELTTVFDDLRREYL